MPNTLTELITDQVRTQFKLAWLGHYLPPAYLELLRISHIVSDPISAIYYTEQSTAFSRVLRPQSAKATPLLACPDFPVYRTPVPAYGTDICRLFYSEAPLNGVLRVLRCYDTNRCIGLLLDYENHSQTVGNFSREKDLSDYFEQPQSIELVYGRDDSRCCIDVKFSRQDAGPDVAVGSPMMGTIVWWYSTDMCDISIVDQ